MEAKRLAEMGALSHGSVIWAATQSAGRGRHGRNWDSPEGNLYYSCFAEINLPPATAAQLSFVTAVVVIDALEEIVGQRMRLQVKWPNDVLLYGKKVGGILLEAVRAEKNRTDLVIGIGINLQSHPSNVAYPATDLAAQGYHAIRPVELVPLLTQKLLSSIDAWVKAGFESFRDAWLEQAFGLSQEITIRDGGEGKELKGVFQGIDPEGRLMLLLPQGKVVPISAGIVALNAQ